MFPPAATNMDTELMLNGAKAALQCTDDACSYPRGMSVHSHDGAEGLKPEWVRQPAQHLLAPVIASVTTAPSRAMRAESQWGTWPPCSGRSALPVRRVMVQATHASF